MNYASFSYSQSTIVLCTSYAPYRIAVAKVATIMNGNPSRPRFHVNLQSGHTDCQLRRQLEFEQCGFENAPTNDLDVTSHVLAFAYPHKQQKLPEGSTFMLVITLFSHRRGVICSGTNAIENSV